MRFMDTPCTHTLSCTFFPDVASTPFTSTGFTWD
jgi:hypothetical protein